MEIQKDIVLDLLDVKSPALSTTSDMPVIETKPDASPAKEPAKESAAPKEPIKEPEAKEPEKSADQEQPEDPSASDEPAKKPAKGVQKRIDELVRREADAVRLADAERQEKLRLLALLEGKKEPEKPVEKLTEDEDAPTRPLKADFADNADGYDKAMDEYIDKRADWKATKAVKADRAEQEQKAQQKAIEDGNKAVQTAYVGRVEKAKEKYPDYQEVAESPDVVVSIPMAHAIMHSEHGPDIAYHLGKNPTEAERISKLSPPLQLVELGLIVASLRTPAAAQPAPKEAVKPPVSNAPKPIKPLGAGSEAVAKSPEEESMEEYAARRKKEFAQERRPGMRH